MAVRRRDPFQSLTKSKGPNAVGDTVKMFAVLCDGVGRMHEDSFAKFNKFRFNIVHLPSKYY